MENLVEIRDVSFAYEVRPVLKGINMVVPRGKVIAIMGLSGCGKTTLLRLIGGSLKPTRGEVRVAGQAPHKLDREGLYALRRKMGMLFQFGALFTDMTTFDNVAFQMREHTNLPESMIRDLVLMKLHAVGLRGARHLMPSELSGGMARRVEVEHAHGRRVAERHHLGARRFDRRRLAGAHHLALAVLRGPFERRQGRVGPGALQVGLTVDGAWRRVGRLSRRGGRQGQRSGQQDGRDRKPEHRSLHYWVPAGWAAARAAWASSARAPARMPSRA